MKTTARYRAVAYTRESRIVSRVCLTWDDASGELEKIGLPGRIEAHVPNFGWVVDNDNAVIVDCEEFA